MTLQEALETALNECKDPFAHSYLCALSLIQPSYKHEGFKAQLLFALSNMQYWRGETAREVKKVLRKYTK